MKSTILPLLLTALSVVAARADSTLTGSAFDFTPANWSNGAPTGGNNGTISSNYTVSGFTASSGSGAYTVTQTSGAGTGSGGLWTGTSDFTFILQGGSLTTSGAVRLTGGNFSITGGSFSTTNFRIENGAVFSLSTGSVSNTLGGGALGYSLFRNNSSPINAGTLNLTGGSVTGVSTITAFLGGNATTVYTTTIGGNTLITGSGITQLTEASASGSTINFLSGWTGSLNFGGSPATDWATQLINGNVTFNGVDLTAGNINQYLLINGGTITAVPEPSTYGLLGAGALAAAALVRRRKRSA